MIRIVLASTLCFLLSVPLLTAQVRSNAATDHLQQPPDWARLVADRFAFGGTDVVAADIIGKFNSFDLLAQTLDLRSIVGNHDGKMVMLRSILLSVDFNANGDVASWKVIGPKPLIAHYIEQLQTGYRTGKLFYDFSVKTYSATICCPD